jgi:arylsulfatase A
MRRKQKFQHCRVADPVNVARSLHRNVQMILLALLLLPFSLTGCETNSTTESGQPPNIIFVLSDDQGWCDVETPNDPDNPRSCEPYLSTPNLTRLAESGMRFSQAYSPAPLCTPTRRSLQCGMTPARQRGTEFKSDFVWAGHSTIPQALKRIDERYRCAHFGKWGTQMNAGPEDAGYDVSDGLTGNVTGGMGVPGKPQTKFVNEIKDDPKLTFSITERANRFMEETVQAGRPFYLQVSYYAIHLALQTRRETLQHYLDKGTPPRQMNEPLCAMVTDMDAGLGLLLDKIDELGIRDNTYLFFAADNGGRDGFDESDDRRPLRNHPLRAAKQFLYEGGIRVPFIVRGPGIPSQSHCAVPVALYDLLPTFAELAGDAGQMPETVDGGSIVNLLDDGKGTVERIFPGLVFHRPNCNFRKDISYSTLRVGDDKLVINWQTGAVELFDLSRDISEANDLSKRMPEKKERMYRQLIDYLTAVNAERPLEGALGF